MLETCQIKGKHILNPIIDWTDKEVWDFIKLRNLPYCSLYDEGFTRLGCIGCPLSGPNGMKRDFERWPKYKDIYIRTFEKMNEVRKKEGLHTYFETGEEVMEWWIGG